jgi:hypothetical protein
MTDTNQPGRSRKRGGLPGLLAFRRGRTIVKDVALGFIAGSVLAVITTILIINAEDVHIQMTVNGWSATLKCDERRNGILLRAACANDIAAHNFPEEEVYW